MVADMLTNKECQPITANKLFIRGEKLNISFVLITQSCFVLYWNISY